MDHQKLLKLAEAGDSDKLTNFLKDIDSEQITKTFESYAVRGQGDPVALLRAVLSGSPCTTTQGISHRLGMYTKAIKLLSGSNLSNNTASEMVGVLLMEADSFTGKSLAELANLYVDSIKAGEITNGKAFELFPKILSALAAKETVAYGNSEMTGGDYKSHVLNTLCSSKWGADCVIHLAAMFRDIPLSPEELKFVIDKILRMFKTMELQELPPLVYQLLLLSTKGHKRLVLEGISSFFNEQDNICREQNKDQRDDDLSTVSSEQLRHMEGTIILHITFAIKQDQELGREFIKYLKAGQQGSSAKILTPFNVALALSIARIHRFEESIFDFLRASIIKSFKDAEKKKSSKWTEELVPESFIVKNQILETVQNSLYGWDHVTQGLVQLGFTLMDSFGPKAGPFGKSAESTSHIKTPSQQACDLGSKVLIETFKVHELVRSEILEQILNRVVTKTTAPVSHYIDLLSNTISSAPQILLDSLPKVREAFDYLAYLPTSSAEGLMKAIQPLMKISMTLKDSLILVLRKAMFSRQGDARKIAVTGFLKILKHFKILGGLPSSQSSQAYSSSSQVQVDVHTQHNPSSNEALCLEILGNLRRCFSQQADVRLLLYEGLYKVLKKNSQLKNTILEMVCSHFKKYYESTTDVNPPILLEPCITAQGEQVFLAEPLAHLICCITQSLLWLDNTSNQGDEGDDEDEGSGAKEELEEMMESLMRRMIKSEMEDFELDKSADFSLSSSVGIKNNIFAIVVMGVYEALIEYQFTGSDFSPSSCEDVLNLFHNYHKLSEILKEKANSAAGKKGRSTAGVNKTARSLLSIKFVSTMLRALFCDSVPGHQESLKSFREDQDFVRYIVNVSLQKIQQINDKGQCDGPEGCDKDRIYRYCTTMARVMLQKYSTDAFTPDEHATKEKGKALSSLCLDGVNNVINIMCSRYPNRVVDFLQRLNTDEDTSGVEDMDDQDIIHQHIKQFQRLTMNILNATDDQDVSNKDAVQLCHIISVLAKYLTSTGQQFVQLHSWVTKICKEQNLDDTSLTKVFLSLLFMLTSQSNTSIVIAKEIAQDIHSQVGDVDQDVEVEDRTHYAIINPRTAAPTVLLLLMSQVDKYLDETDWVLSLLKADALNSNIVTSMDHDSPGPTQRETLDKAVCTRLGTLVTVFHELVQSALPAGLSVDSLLKTLTRMYSTLALLTKYYIALYTQRVGHLSARFEKLAKLTGTHLTQQCYALINYIQTSQNEQLTQAAQAGKANTLKEKKKNESASTSGKAKVLKEAKSIPNLIFSIEQYEKFLIQLTKKSKINLMEHFKVSTSRDFRINTAAVRAALEQQETSSSDENEENEDQGTNEEDEPAAKKSKLENKGNKTKKGSK
ncbi:Fanconi anemia group I protein-like [Ptychodera flava]|uniref:Fanconi anemia group I protein-like n=1 Tax=Ptychodera flava TaxID=63121 RepID=UPI003969ED8E